MNLKLTEKETKVLKWALINWSVRIEDSLKTIPEKDVWDLYEEELQITEEILKKISDEESNKRED